MPCCLVKSNRLLLVYPMWIYNLKEITMKDKLLESISLMEVNGNRLELPSDVQFSNYAQVKKTLQVAGGKYKKCGFEFTESAGIVKQRLLGGEAVNDKKKFQFFPTPLAVVDILMNRANIASEMVVFEPSAGQGAIADAIFKIGAHASMIELMPENVNVLNRKYNCNLEPTDFLSVDPESHIKYNRIVANPPFTKNQDIDHILHMYKFLDDGGLIVSMASTSWINGMQKKQVAFRNWLDSICANVEEVPAGAFKESGTNIATVIICIKKRQ